MSVKNREVVGEGGREAWGWHKQLQVCGSAVSSSNKEAEENSPAVENGRHGLMEMDLQSTYVKTKVISVLANSLFCVRLYVNSDHILD